MYRQRPYLKIDKDITIHEGYENVIHALYNLNKKNIAFETYPGVNVELWKDKIRKTSTRHLRTYRNKSSR